MNKADLPSTAGTETIEKDFLVPGKASSCMQNDAEVKDWQEFDPMMKQANPAAQLKGYDMTGLYHRQVQSDGCLKTMEFCCLQRDRAQRKAAGGCRVGSNWLVSSSQDNIDIWLMGTEGKNWKKEDNMRYSEVAGTDPTTNYRRQMIVIFQAFQAVSNALQSISLQKLRPSFTANA